MVSSWLNRHQRDAIEYLRAENRVLRERLGPKRLRLTDAERRPHCPDTHRLVIFPTKSVSDEVWNSRLRRSSVTHAMVPVTVQFIIAMLAHALNERMARRV